MSSCFTPTSASPETVCSWRLTSMVEQLLLLATATSLLSAKTGLAKTNTHVAPNTPQKLLNLLTLDPQLEAHTTCLQLLTCQHDSAFNFGFMEIHHADLPELSAEACSGLCLRHRPRTQLVMVKMASSDGHLVCGCGDRAALQTPSDWPLSFTTACPHLCPDGGGRCGGPTAVSVYQLNRRRGKCIEPQFTYHGCYLDEVGARAVTLEPWERWAGGCIARCGSPTSPEAHLIKMVTTYDGETQCECW